MRISLVRESGGIGDCIVAGGTCRQVKIENPDAQLAVFCPENFRFVYEHTCSFARIVSLGLVQDLGRKRRPRLADLANKKQMYPYLTPLYRWKSNKVVDLWCPGNVHETSTRGPLIYNRSQLFALAAGCENFNVRPVWTVTAEEAKFAFKWLENLDMKPNGFIAMALRGTCSARSYPADYCVELIKLIRQVLPIVYLDCVMPHFPSALDLVTFAPLPFHLSAAVVNWSRAVVTIDTSILHLAAALNSILC